MAANVVSAVRDEIYSRQRHSINRHNDAVSCNENSPCVRESDDRN